MENNAEMYLKAAKLIASCPRDRLELVLQVLEKGGIEFERLDEILERMSAEEKKAIYGKRKNDDKRDNWLKSDNAITLLLREAYDKNVSMTVISNLSGVHRVTLYKYLRGVLAPGAKTSTAIKEAIEKIFNDIENGEDLTWITEQ